MNNGIKSICSILFFLLFFNVQSVFSQHVIKEADIQFSLNDTVWMQITSNNDKTPTQTVYRFKRQQVKNADGKEIVPFISVLVEKKPDSTSVYQYSRKVMDIAPMTDVFDLFDKTGLAAFPDAIGYRGIYTEANGTKHTTTLIFLYYKNKVVQMVLDIHTEVWERYSYEFEGIIRSLKPL